MSRYLQSLIDRARGEGAMLEPRARGRFEPEPAFAESTVAETANVARISVENIEQTNIASTHIDVHNAAPTQIVEQTQQTVEVRPVSEQHTNTLRVETTRLTELRERLERERTQHESNETLVREREQHTERELREHFTERDRIERTTRTRERSEHTTHRERTRVEHEPAAPIQITIGRVDVRAVAPQAQPPQRAQTKPKPTPLTLDDYLRGKR